MKDSKKYKMLHVCFVNAAQSAIERNASLRTINILANAAQRYYNKWQYACWEFR